MIVTITVEAPDLAKRSQQFPAAVQAGLRRVAEHVQQIAIRQVGEIYKRPIPSRAQVAAYRRSVRAGGRPRRPRNVGGGLPAWERSGQLMAQVQAEPVFEKDSVTLSVDLPYGRRRHELGVSWMPKEPALGIIRRDPFFAQTVEITAPQITALFEDGFSAAMEGF